MIFGAPEWMGIQGMDGNAGNVGMAFSPLVRSLTLTLARCSNRLAIDDEVSVGCWDMICRKLCRTGSTISLFLPRSITSRVSSYNWIIRRTVLKEQSIIRAICRKDQWLYLCNAQIFYSICVTHKKMW